MEILATPNWEVETTTIERWIEAFESQGLAVHVSEDSSGVTWLEVPSVRLRGYVLQQGLNIEAVDFQLPDNAILPARAALESAAERLGWELDDEPFEDDA